RPRSSPAATPPGVVALVVRLRKQLAQDGLDAGPATIVWHLHHHHQVSVSTATVARILTREELITPAPKKRPKASYIRFQAAMPNETWQSDFTHYRLTDGTEYGTDAEIITWLDDHSRFALHCSAHQPVTAKIVLATFRTTVAGYEIPASTLTDNGMVYTVRFATGRGGRTALEAELHRLHITQKNSRPNHPTTCGKVERFQQTLKKWLRAQPVQPTTLAELQALIDVFIDGYNHRRPHRSLPHQATPAAAYQARPKAAPSAERTGQHHDRVRRDRVDTDGKLTLRVNGRLHHIGIGRTLARTPVILLIHNLDVRVIDAATGELLRELTIDPSRDYQPTGKDRYTRRRKSNN
ncbi:MAG: integrase core domain-containing protein, partial [Actinobacteria bacterium]|nr:integrase core domain-containing protein [Actinomycetota bacterium]